MEESYHHHHHHHHHGHQADGPAESIVSDQRAETISQTSEEVQQSAIQTTTTPITVPRANAQAAGGVQTASSFHSVSSMDSSAEMAKYFPDVPTPNLSLSNRQQQAVEVTNTSSYVTAPAVQPQLPQAAVRVAQQQQALRAPAAPQLPPGIPSYFSPIEGLSVSQTIVNDVIIDLQSKVINETQQQYHDGFSSGNYFEPLSPIYIRAPNPTIILRSDLHRLRAQLNARPAPRHAGSINQFQVPSFPPP